MNEKPTINKYLVIFLILMSIVVTWKVTDHFSDKKIEKQLLENKKLKIAGDSLQKVTDGHYRKLVADTLTTRQLKKEIDSLKIKVKNPIIVEKIKLQPIEVEKPIDSLDIKKDSITITDYYPKKDNWFTKYHARISLRDSSSIGNFSFNEIGINLVISENKDGTYQTDLKAPEFIKINSIDILSLPMEPTKKDNFGILAGGMINKNFENGNLGYEIMGGFRIKKVNVITSANTNKEVALGSLIEF